MSEPGFGVYVHWPFCAAKCPYCDFNSHVRHKGVDQGRYLAAFRREIAHMAALAPGRKVASVFFGGGTPSLMTPETVGGILDAIGAAWEVEPNAEITLEANPTSVEAERFRGYRAAGVNRVSLGVQALNAADLANLGRMHTVEEALAAVELAMSIFPRASFDLIYARPGQSPAAWRKELSQAIERAPEHLSLYQLTIEEGTPFHALYRAGKLKTPDEETSRALWDVTQETTERAGMPAYEISNHARPGAESRHNLVYWRYGEYAGVGPGAHGRLLVDDLRRELSTERNPELWAAAVEADGHGLVIDEPLSVEAQADEFLLMGLRLAEGIDLARFHRLSGRRLDPRRIDDLTMDGMVERVGRDRLRVTREGFPVLDAVVADLAG
ncbi:oxygen-independent coproporphyrinogen-3 oxidase [Methylopila capsulata]|uniref:Heme chaperone HemW n=1 Tax=Methylopila capsulata TaxID=61654 RepID=A0A9W6IWN7_9HYPH|nr:radical SAM family heme chaperone HemW [Methylopila capsulata]MBM7852749.1 oxygen-independent coproporphyrinogen-3 oxidase [Methylopila capsulata]GLK56959.1 coproporphyrinogen III oxidase [Methylopila capsulata]